MIWIYLHLAFLLCCSATYATMKKTPTPIILRLILSYKPHYMTNTSHFTPYTTLMCCCSLLLEQKNRKCTVRSSHIVSGNQIHLLGEDLVPRNIYNSIYKKYTVTLIKILPTNLFVCLICIFIIRWCMLLPRILGWFTDFLWLHDLTEQWLYAVEKKTASMESISVC